MNSKHHSSMAPVSLTIAGSDCSGGAGLEADLKTFAAHHVYGMATVTCVVSENPLKVVSIHSIPPRLIRHQIKCCLEGMPAMPVKCGMLHSKPIIQALHQSVSEWKKQISTLIVDPVMVSTSGSVLLKKEGINALCHFMGEHADLVTPNLDEAVLLSGCPIRNEAQMERAAGFIARKFSTAVLLKGGHLKNPQEANDFYFDGKQGFWLKGKRIRGVKTHGTGCTYSAAIAANLALGRSLPHAVRKAKLYLSDVIASTVRFPRWMALGHNSR